MAGCLEAGGVCVCVFFFLGGGEVGWGAMRGC